ncbi:MAG TPA: ABC transporter ATP-binding protein [Bacteroidales bacterium]|nr:ABC transporter ATP-binding protein [Bacteroidales bacterium]HQB22037.1 ABC transporter ATP-binding protein [Bacteroidales bacterium]
MITLKLENISFSYPTGFNSKLRVLNNLSLTAESGNIIGLVGKNGSGKTTLLNILKGVISPETGSFQIYTNEEIFTQSFIPLVSQNVDSNLFPTMTVFENFCIVKNKHCSPFKKYYSKSNYSYCQDLLLKANMGIEDKIDEQVRFLSGGQKQALSILLALENDLPILLMDEPTASLDPFVSESIIGLAKKEIQARDGILFLVSHNLNDIIKYSNRILILSDMKVKEITHKKNTSELELMSLM